jgi:hypothetical protein
MRIKLILALALLAIVIMAGANNKIGEKSEPILKKNNSEKVKPQSQKNKKSVDSLVQTNTDPNLEAIVINNNKAITYKPIFAEKKIKLRNRIIN